MNQENYAVLTRENAQNLLAFCNEHSQEQFYFAKDHGAYFGQNTGSKEQGTFKNIVIYVEGCNPDVDSDWYENALNDFGEDDFCEYFPVSLLKDFLDTSYEETVYQFTETEINVGFR